MATATTNLLGLGLYTAEEAARYARLHPKTMKRWLFGDNSGTSVVNAQLRDTGERLVTFLDFVQALAIRSVRVVAKGSNPKVPLTKIRAAYDRARSEYDLDYPLATLGHRIYLFGPRERPDLCEIIVKVGDVSQPDSHSVQLTGKSAGNRMITRVAEQFMTALRFDGGALPIEYRAWGNDECAIVMNPHQSLGEPYLPSCGYTARALFEAYLSEGGIEQAAAAYGVKVEEIELAYSYYDYLLGTEAA